MPPTAVARSPLATPRALASSSSLASRRVQRTARGVYPARRPRRDVFRVMASASPATAPGDLISLLGTMDRTVVAERGALHLQTPLILSKPMSERFGRDVYVKLDAFQPSGSFKLRGIGYTCQKAVASDGARAFVSSSGGNAGLATAYAGQMLKIPTTVVVPQSTPAFIRARLEAYDAKVIVHGAQWSEANERAAEINASANGKMVHPFEDADTWTGHATVVHEIASELRALGAIRWVPTGGTLNEEEEEEEGEKAVPAMPGAFVTCVGGGGLLAGILQGLSEVGWGDDVPVIAAETIGADSLASSVDAGEVVTLPGISSVAKSLGAASPSPTVLEMCLKRRVGSKKLARPWRTTDRDAVEACVKFANDHRVLVEPACGAALAAIYSGKCDELKECSEGPIVVQVCGGAVIDLPTLAAYAKQFDVDFD